MCASLESSLRKAASRHSRPAAGFTLIELLVAFAVLTLLVLFMIRIWSAAGTSAMEGKRRIDNFAKARSTMDVFARDVKAGIFRPDLAAFVDHAGTNAISLYTRRPAVGTDVRNVSLVVYQLDATKAILRRGALPVSWNDSPDRISYNNTTTLPMTSNVTPEDVANGVLRMSVSFIDAAGSVNKAYSTNARVVGLTLATVDENTLQLLSQAQLSRLTANDKDLPDDPSANPGQTLKAFWDSKLGTPGFFDNYPAQLRSGLRIFERHVVLPVD